RRAPKVALPPPVRLFPGGRCPGSAAAAGFGASDVRTHALAFGTRRSARAVDGHCAACPARNPATPAPSSSFSCPPGPGVGSIWGEISRRCRADPRFVRCAPGPLFARPFRQSIQEGVATPSPRQKSVHRGVNTKLPTAEFVFHSPEPSLAPPPLSSPLLKIADAYFVLSDPGRRASYDSAYRTVYGSGSRRQTAAGPARQQARQWNDVHAEADAVFGDVFYDLLKPEVDNPWWFWTPVGTIAGIVLGFIIANLPGAVLGGYAGNKLGVVRDNKGKSVMEVFNSFSHQRKRDILSAIAKKAALPSARPSLQGLVQLDSASLGTFSFAANAWPEERVFEGVPFRAVDPGTHGTLMNKMGLGGFSLRSAPGQQLGGVRWKRQSAGRALIAGIQDNQQDGPADVKNQGVS
ncbi:MAG: hypothetical protein BJ554DRAFT_4322, partial [Olpidium bornovanus]